MDKIDSKSSQYLKRTWLNKMRRTTTNLPTASAKKLVSIVKTACSPSSSSPLMHARLIKILISLDEDHVLNQKTMLRDYIEPAIKMLFLYNELVQRRYGSATADAGKLATYGIGHCHGLSSVAAAILYPLCHVLGIYTRYCGGYTFERRAGASCTTAEEVFPSNKYHVPMKKNSATSTPRSQMNTPRSQSSNIQAQQEQQHVVSKMSSETHVSNTVERHQSLELALFPSMEMCLFDLTRARLNLEYVGVDTIWAYTEGPDGLYANGKAMLESKVSH
eukprot:GSA25T00000896001.1